MSEFKELSGLLFMLALGLSAVAGLVHSFFELVAMV